MPKRGPSGPAGPAAELAVLLEAGDHRAAAALARRELAAGPASDEGALAAARAALLRLGADRVEVVISLGGLGLLASVAALGLCWRG